MYKRIRKMTSIENRIYRMLINGSLVSSTESFGVINPATGKKLASAPHASCEQVNSAIGAANKGFAIWSRMAQPERAQRLLNAASIIEANRVDLEHIISKEQGKTLAGAASETNTAISLFRQAAEIILPVKHVKETPTHQLKTVRVPVGVVVGITPWNYPLSLGVGKIARALGYGNSIILKPSPFTPLSSLYLGEILKDIFPPGVVNVVTGSDAQGPISVGQQLTESPGINLVSFTGSVPTGKRIMVACARNITRVLLELGGNDPAIVLPDANVVHAAKGIFQMCMANCGQICCAIKRVYVHNSVYEEFTDEVVKLANEAVQSIGEGTKDGVKMGPLNNAQQLQRVKELVSDAKKHGGLILAGGKQPPHTDPNGYFFEPTIVTNVVEGIRVVDEEQFGPIMPVMPYSDEGEVIERSNRGIYGLGASVWGRDPVVLNRIAERLNAGIVWTNEHAVLREGGTFGGMKQSGFRREGDFAEADLDSYTEMKTLKLAK